MLRHVTLRNATQHDAAQRKSETRLADDSTQDNAIHYFIDPFREITQFQEIADVFAAAQRAAGGT